MPTNTFANPPNTANAGAPAPAIQWHWGDFESLSRRDVYDALQLRARVFILEQGPYLDVDGLDVPAFHLLGRLAEPRAGLPAGELVLYLRALPPGLKFAEPALGRVVCHAGPRFGGRRFARLRTPVARPAQPHQRPSAPGAVLWRIWLPAGR